VGGWVCAQSEYGDIYKCTLEYKTAGDVEMVTELKLKYFDTLPTCAALCVLKTGFLFAGSEFGNHALYQFQGIGDHADDVESSSSTSSLPSSALFMRACRSSCSAASTI
jgi:splicing factor 3B subunit 3